jgi:hypothetical protein
VDIIFVLVANIKTEMNIKGVRVLFDDSVDAMLSLRSLPTL